MSQQKYEQNGVAWAIKIIDELHFKAPAEFDYEYKGIKNTLRDRYKEITGIDPAPSYPIRVEIKGGES